MSKPQLGNRFTGKREDCIELDGLKNPDAIAAFSVPPHDIEDNPGSKLYGLGFNSLQIEFMVAYYDEGYTLRELPQRLGWDASEVERIRKQVARRIKTPQPP